MPKQPGRTDELDTAAQSGSVGTGPVAARAHSALKRSGGG